MEDNRPNENPPADTDWHQAVEEEEIEEEEDLHLISEDPQVLFDTAIHCLAKQGRVSRQPLDHLGEEGSCLYEDEGRRCAIGWVMTADALRAFGDHVEGIDSLCEHHGFNAGSVNLEFLESLQRVHDNAHSRMEFRTNALKFAGERQLSSAAVDEALTPEWCSNPTWEPEG